MKNVLNPLAKRFFDTIRINCRRVSNKCSYSVTDVAMESIIIDGFGKSIDNFKQTKKKKKTEKEKATKKFKVAPPITVLLGLSFIYT